MYIVEKQKNGRYAVKKKGASRASKTFDTYQEAILYCTKKNKELGIETTTKEGTNSTVKKRKNSQVSKPKKSGIKMFLLSLLVMIVIVAFIFVFIKYIKPNMDNVGTDSSTTTNNNNNSAEGVIYDDFQIHFMMLGNDKAGDSIYIKAGDTDILIDAGSRKGSSQTTLPYMNQYVKDNKLEYVIMTHGDQDHIEAFPNILNTYSADTIIYNQYTTKTTNAYKNTLVAFNKQKNNGANIYYASDCWNNTNGASREYKLSTNVTMSILYNEYYFKTQSDENNYSVCTLFTYDSGTEKHYFMFTGDLEREGEEAMAAYYDGSTKEKTLPQVDLFKAGHHGSKTSSNECLLSLIKPKMCVVSCCCGTNEYTGVTDNQFPTQEFISRISKYTDAVYVTSIYESYEIATKADKENVPGVSVGGNYIKTSGYKAMNGNIIVSCNDTGVGLFASNNLIKLKESEWFNTKIIIDGKERPMRIWG